MGQGDETDSTPTVTVCSTMNYFHDELLVKYVELGNFL